VTLIALNIFHLLAKKMASYLSVDDKNKRAETSIYYLYSYSTVFNN